MNVVHKILQHMNTDYTLDDIRQLGLNLKQEKLGLF